MSIDSLPPELFCQIFVVVIDLDGWNGVHPPIVLSHVCAKWRQLVLQNPYLWSRISLLGFKNDEVVDALLSRSRDVPLDLAYASLPDSSSTLETTHVLRFLRRLSRHFLRCKDLSFQSSSVSAMTFLLPYLKNPSTFFPMLQRLSLSLSTSRSSYVEAQHLHQRQDIGDESPSNSSSLRHLVLNRVPFYSLPTEFICNLRKLELSFSPGTHPLFRHHYHHLKLSNLCAFLSLTPQLEELILNNTVPDMDALPAPLQIPNPLSIYIHLQPVRLEHLKTFEWTYPSCPDVPRLLCLLDLPVLDKLDLWVEKQPLRRHRPSIVTEYMHFTPSFPMLRDLSLQCNGDEAMLSVLRRFSIPAVERVAFTNIDPGARKQVQGKEPDLMVFPRLETIFHDPRLPLLTHLTLSHFKIPSEAGRGESLLGYMPLLTSLSLDSCIGTARLLEGLQEKLIIGTMSNAADPKRPSKRGVKLCPRLEALSIWGCRDVDFGSLRAVVLARNVGTTKEIPTQADGADTETKCPPHGTNVIGQQHQLEGTRDGYPADCELLTERKIKPLKSLRAASMMVPSDPMTKIVSTLIALREVLEPANIIYVRVAQCKLVTEHQALSLRDLGVIDVIWASSD